MFACVSVVSSVFFVCIIVPVPMHLCVCVCICVSVSLCVSVCIYTCHRSCSPAASCPMMGLSFPLRLSPLKSIRSTFSHPQRTQQGWEKQLWAPEEIPGHTREAKQAHALGGTLVTPQLMLRPTAILGSCLRSSADFSPGYLRAQMGSKYE